MTDYTPTTDKVLAYIRGNAVMDGASAVEAQEAAANWLAVVQREAAARAIEEAVQLIEAAHAVSASTAWLRARAAEIRGDHGIV